MLRLFVLLYILGGVSCYLVAQGFAVESQKHHSGVTQANVITTTARIRRTTRGAFLTALPFDPSKSSALRHGNASSALSIAASLPPQFRQSHLPLHKMALRQPTPISRHSGEAPHFSPSSQARQGEGGHKVVRGRWAPPPMERKGPRDEQW